MATALPEYTTYIKNGQTVLVDSSHLFVYQTCVYAFYKGYFSLCNSQFYSCHKEIQGVVGSFFKTPHIQICSELFAAPEKWLIDNEYVIYSRPEKISKVKHNIEGNDG
jgi:hypothetical protein